MRGILVKRQPEVLAWLKTRRSIRRFAEMEIPRQKIEALLETAIWAPSAHNRQPWRFAVVSSQITRQKLAEAMGEVFYADLLSEGMPADQARQKATRSIQHIQAAPVAIVLCLDQSDMDVYPDRRRQELETIMAIQSVALAGGQLLLAAHAEGLGAYWNCAPLFAPNAVRAALDLPSHWHPQALILAGQPASQPEPPRRLPVAEVVRFI